MLKTEITFERILGTFAPGALFIFGIWYLHRPFFLKYFPNLVGGIVERVSETGTQIEQIGSVSVGAKLVLFVLVAFCIGIVVNQIAESLISILLLEQDRVGNSKWVRFRQRLRKWTRMLTLTYSREDPRYLAVSAFVDSARKRFFLRMVRNWTKTSRDLMTKLNTDPSDWPAEVKRETVSIFQHLVTRLEVMPGASRQVYDEQHFSLNFIASLMVTFLLLFPVALFSFFTSNLTSGEVKVHYTITLIAMVVATYVGIAICGLLLKRQFRKMCRHLLTTAYHLYLITYESQELEDVQKKEDKLVIDPQEELQVI